MAHNGALTWHSMKILRTLVTLLLSICMFANIIWSWPTLLRLAVSWYQSSVNWWLCTTAAWSTCDIAFMCIPSSHNIRATPFNIRWMADATHVQKSVGIIINRLLYIRSNSQNLLKPRGLLLGPSLQLNARVKPSCWGCGVNRILDLRLRGYRTKNRWYYKIYK